MSFHSCFAVVLRTGAVGMRGIKFRNVELEAASKWRC